VSWSERAAKQTGGVGVAVNHKSDELQLSDMQKKILVLILRTQSHSPGPLPVRGIGRALGVVSIYYSCHSLEKLEFISIQRSPNRQLFLELADAGRTVAAMLLEEEYQAEKERRLQTECRVLPFRPLRSKTQDIEVDIRGRLYTANRAAFVIRPDGSASLALWSKNSGQAWLNGDVVQVAEWYQTCYDAGLPVNVQVNDGFGSDFGVSG
jgi:DNA-binding MarR family transcriptional regulator